MEMIFNYKKDKNNSKIRKEDLSQEVIDIILKKIKRKGNRYPNPGDFVIMYPYEYAGLHYPKFGRIIEKNYSIDSFIDYINNDWEKEYGYKVANITVEDINTVKNKNNIIDDIISKYTYRSIYVRDFSDKSKIHDRKLCYGYDVLKVTKKELEERMFKKITPERLGPAKFRYDN